MLYLKQLVMVTLASILFGTAMVSWVSDQALAFAAGLAIEIEDRP